MDLSRTNGSIGLICWKAKKWRMTLFFHYNEHIFTTFFSFSSKWYLCSSKLDFFYIYFSTFGLISLFSETRLQGTKDVEVVGLMTALATPLLVAPSPCWCAASVLAFTVLLMTGSFWISDSLLANEEHFVSEIRDIN